MARKRKGAVAVGVAVGLLALPAAANAAVTSNVNAGLLTVTSDAADAITITCVANAVQVNGASPPGGPHACNTITAIDVNGGPGANAITLTGVTTAAFPALADVDIDGAGGDDTIAGSEIDDVMHGGPGDDRILGDDNAPGTRDEFLGEDGNDTLVWNPGDDDDKMDGGLGADSIEVNGGGGPEQFVVQPSAIAGRVVFDRTGPTPPGPFNLDIGTAERLDMNANGGDDQFDANGVLAGLIALDVDGGEGNDLIDGGDGADLLKGGGGNDRIIPDNNPAGTRDDAKGDAGDDTLVWNGGDGDDINDGGDGNDTVEVNGAAVGEQFTIKPGAVAGRFAFDRLGPTPPGLFSIDIGTSERLDMNLAGGDDSFVADPGVTMVMDVDGSDGNDTIDAGDAADLIAAGAGNDRIVPDDNPPGTRDIARGDAGDDTIVWNPGDDDDINEGGDGNDVSEVNGGTGPEDFTINPGAAPGRVSFDRTGPTPPGPFNVDIGTTELLRLNANDGNDEIKGAKGIAGRILTELNGDGGNDEIKGTDAEDRLSGGKGFDLIKSRDKAEDTVSCDSGIDLAIVDRRDFVRQCEIVLGGRLRVAMLGAGKVRGDAASLRLRCVATAKCVGTAKVVKGKKTMAKARYSLKRGKPKSVALKLTPKGRKALAAGKLRGQLRLDTRDAQGNGWRTTAKLTLAR